MYRGLPGPAFLPPAWQQGPRRPVPLSASAARPGLHGQEGPEQVRGAAHGRARRPAVNGAHAAAEGAVGTGEEGGEGGRSRRRRREGSERRRVKEALSLAPDDG